MTAARHGGWLFLAALGIVVFAFAQAAGEDNAFMPKGGRALLLDLLGVPPDQAELRAIAQARRTESEWRDFVAARKKALSERELATLAAYLAVNLPLSDGAVKRDKLASALPPDGRVLAWNECQSCHSLFASHLTQRRNAQGWRNMFVSPFHRELKMNPQEREEFARYSALNMPMKIEDVPQELRF
jgi:mono/diheme cytochrome c family protein